MCPVGSCMRPTGHDGPHGVDDQPAVLLRDTPEDRERLAAAIYNEDALWRESLPVLFDEHIDAIIAALRGEG